MAVVASVDAETTGPLSTSAAVGAVVNQPAFDFFGYQDRETLPPVNGKTEMSRNSSYSGAVHAAETRSANIWTLRQLWREPLTINDVAALAHLPVSSVCSLKAAIADELEEVDQELIIWGNHGDRKRRHTKRTRWRIKGANRNG